MQCVSNEVGGDLIGTARWTGIRLDELLDEAGVQAGAEQVMGESVDGFTAGFPVEVARDGRDALLVVGMNGHILPVGHGAPLRVRVERQLGYKMAKFVMRIEAVDDLSAIGEGKGGYWEDVAGYQWYAGI